MAGKPLEKEENVCFTPISWHLFLSFADPQGTAEGGGKVMLTFPSKKGKCKLKPKEQFSFIIMT